MTNVTPHKSHNKQTPSGFSPVILQQSPTVSSPGGNLTGPPRLAKDLAADLYNNIQKWNNLHVDGADLVKNIASERTSNEQYTVRLEELTDELYKVFKSMETCVSHFRDLASQAAALAKISPDPLFLSLNGTGVRRLVEDVVEAYLQEYEVKRMVLENIAHSKDDHQAMFFAASWTLQPNITSTISMKLEALLVECGHRTIN